MISQDLEQMSKQSINSLSSLLSGRLGWFFNFQGPNLTLDTACSSGFVALDLGCKSLYDRSADMVRDDGRMWSHSMLIKMVEYCDWLLLAILPRTLPIAW